MLATFNSQDWRLAYRIYGKEGSLKVAEKSK